MEYGQETSINPFCPHKSSVSNPGTDLDSSSSWPESFIITIPSRTKETDADLCYKEWDSSFIEQRTWSFIKFISLAEIIVFTYHVILLANEGVTVDMHGPTYNEVKQNNAILIY